jgi:two-component system alkaline phosphatase synthesis response regulator PhoP
VLVIDDEPDVLLLCRVNLQYAGHEVLTAEGGVEGLRLAITERPDLVLLDVMLPERDGISILRDLSEHPVTVGTPIVLLSAKAQVHDRLRGWRAGCSEYITKPFSPVDLREVLETVQAMSAGERERRRAQAIEDLASCA